MDYSQALFLYVAALKLCDALCVVAVWYGCWYLRFYSQLFPVTKGLPDFQIYAEVALPLLLVFSAVLHVVGAYRSDRIHFGFRSGKKIIEGSILGTLVFIATIYFRGEMDYSRIYLVIFLGAVILALLLERLILQGVWSILEASLVKRIRILLVGGGELLQMYLYQLQSRRPYPVEWVGRLGEKNVADVSAPFPGVPYLGEEDRVRDVLRDRRVDVIVISFPTNGPSKYGEILEWLSHELVTVKVLPDFGKYSTFTYSADQECGIPLLQFNKSPVGATDRFLKRTVDILGAVFVLGFFFPVYFAIAALIKLTSRGPILYSQTRMGADGRVFTLFKFRSMRTDAEKQTGAVWASANDNRTTPLGKWLRKTSLDEIPQFYNVLRGDMSLVGPRPERPVFVDQFRKEVPKYMLRHKMKSGITGWAQVNGWRGNTSIEERIKHDLFYIGHWSHVFDIKILALTLLKGFVHRHAY